MASKELIKYVKEHVAAGFSVENIKLELVKHGHPVADVEAALSEIPVQKKEKPKTSLIKFLVLLTVIIAVGIVLFFVLSKIKTEQIKEIEVKGEVIPPVVPPSPEAAPEVLPEEVPPYIPPYVQPQKEIPEKKTEALPPEAAPTGREIPIYDISRLGFNLTPRLEVIRGVSLQNPDAAVAMCADFHTNAERDVCFATIARNIPDNKLCARITEAILRDQCYLAFAVTGTDACDKINDTVVKESCNALIHLNLTGRMP
jgi:hypothetical protein